MSQEKSKALTSRRNSNSQFIVLSRTAYHRPTFVCQGIDLAHQLLFSGQRMRLQERIVYGLIAIIILAAVILARVAPELLDTVYLDEDGILEWQTLLVLLFISILCFTRASRLKAIRPTLFTLSLMGIGCAFLFVAGEELSWGQRIFGIETPEWLKELNQQDEINIHNLKIGGISVNKVIFGKLLSFVLAFYLFVLPWWSGRSPSIGRMIERFALPIPTTIQALAFLPALILPDLLFDHNETDELREACGSLLLLILFCFPRNAYLYSSEWRTGEQPPR